jgi:hypothetical protein
MPRAAKPALQFSWGRFWGTAGLISHGFSNGYVLAGLIQKLILKTNPEARCNGWYAANKWKVVYPMPLGAGTPVWQRSVHSLFLQQTSKAETECLKISCAWVFVSSTIEYLSNERTLPETFAPFSKWTVMCLPPVSATFKNDS